MKKIILLWMIHLILTTAAYAEVAEVTGGYTYIIFTNNTKSNLNLKINLLTKDSAFKKGRDWNDASGDLIPYQSKKILWFSRNINVKANQSYQFDILVHSHQQSHPDLIFSITEKGRSVFGSEMYSELSFPGKTKHKILNDQHFQMLTEEFWGNTYQVYVRRWTPSAKVFDNYHFILDESKIKSMHLHTPHELSVLSYNTQLMPFYTHIVNKLNHPTIRAKDIPEKISTYDVVILQELFDTDLQKDIAQFMSVYYPFHTKVVGYHTTKALSGGVMIFSKWPIVKEDQIVYQASADIDSMAAKGVIYAAIDKMGIMYHIFGTHLQAAEANGGELAREKQLQELENFIESLHIPLSQAVLIGGDFNVNHIKPQFKFLQNTLHVDLPENIGYPYSADSYVNTMNTGTNRSRIDFVFFSHLHLKPRLAYNNIFILRDLDNEAMWPDFDLSDHFPVAGYFEFN